MRLHASLKHERRVAVAIAGWMQLLLDLNEAALKTLTSDMQAVARSAILKKGFPYVFGGSNRYYCCFLHSVLVCLQCIKHY